MNQAQRKGEGEQPGGPDKGPRFLALGANPIEGLAPIPNHQYLVTRALQKPFE